ncbi:hypothetical protein B0H17DRAFT_1333949 [Mycena rosella]|uniref:F-box domain-containing protein n=1 Tax=Mycena rosella TaxID=1033263 RepID=A0AAD7D524_MYCRO|nr:hypothetical protein B0H17DRAFT_1333949 [Mycena rosella]
MDCSSHALSLPGLPVEILGIISEFSAKSTLVALCQTNQRIHAACFRDIYHTVHLNSLASAVKCSQTFISNPIYAEEVRTLKMVCYPRRTFRRFDNLVQSAMAHLRNLESILLHVSPSLFTPVARVHFPRLRECVISCAADPSPFLSRNTGLASLLVLPKSDEDPSNIPPTSRIYMPVLRNFAGPGTLATAVVPHSRVWRASIFWHLQRHTVLGYAETIASLALSGRKVLMLDNVVTTWDTALLAAIIAGMRHLTDLSIRNPSGPDPVQIQVFVSYFDGVIAALPTLTSISVTQEPLRPSGLLDPHDLEPEFSAVRRWGDISPALRCAVLPSETAWSRVRNDVWYPATKSPNISDMLVRVKWFLMRVVTSTDLCAGYVSIAEVVAGKQTVCVLRGALEDEGRIPAFEIAPDPAGMVISFVED